MLLSSNIRKYNFKEVWLRNSAFSAQFRPVENNKFEASVSIAHAEFCKVIILVQNTYILPGMI